MEHIFGISIEVLVFFRVLVNYEVTRGISVINESVIFYTLLEGFSGYLSSLLHSTRFGSNWQIFK